MTKRASMHTGVARLNTLLAEYYDDGYPVKVQLAKPVRPQLEVVSFQPFEYRPYGRVLNRAPEIVGPYAVRQFMTRQEQNVDGTFGTAVILGLEGATANQGYGVELDLTIPESMATFRYVAAEVGATVGRLLDANGQPVQ